MSHHWKNNAAIFSASLLYTEGMKQMDSLIDVWSAVCQACRQHISEVGFNAWIKIIEPIELRAGEVILGVSSDF